MVELLLDKGKKALSQGYSEMAKSSIKTPTFLFAWLNQNVFPGYAEAELLCWIKVKRLPVYANGSKRD